MFNPYYDRELSGCSERHVRRAISSNVQCLQRMCLQRKLEAHAGCVNTVSFDTEGGDVLISGSDDQQILLWDWHRGTVRLRFESGHANNIFQARMLPHSSGSRLITCAADGEVRLVELPEGAGSLSVAKTLLGEHMGRAHKLALDPLNPGCCFYSSGEDGQVVHYDLRCGSGPSQQQQQQQQLSGNSSSSSRRSGSRLKLLLCQGYSKARGPTNRVVGINAIHVNPTRPWQFAVGGSDAWARVYDLRKTRDPPQNPSSSGSSSVTGGRGSDLAAAAAAAAACYGRDRYWIRSNSSSTDATAAGEQQQQQQQQQQQRIGQPTRAEVRYSRVYGLVDEPVARLCPEPLWGSRASGLGGDPSITCVMFSQQGELLASYNDDDIYMFSSQASCGFLDLNSSSSSSSDAAGHVGSNSRATVKGVSYFGESDEYVVSGSDCGHVFVWSKVGGEVVWWAAADEEVVNCLEPHPLLPHVLATSGIEHDIKIWAPTAQQPQPPNPTSIRAAMASNRRGRDTSREVMSEPEQWLLQLLAAQRRRSRATERLRRAEAAAAAGGGGSGRQAAATQQQQHTQPRAAAAGNNPDQDMFAEEDDDDDDNDADADAEEELEELAANPFARLLARPGALRLRFAGDDDDDDADEDDAAAPAAGVGIGGRQRRRRVAGAAAAAGDGAGDGEGGVSSSEEGEGQESDGGGGGDEGDDERPCYVS
ncbi:hypothetical protein OEZ85_000180 [Tetradesmus obliquus]|uniref:Uncharacterized protein n=1 Tax=Tetradesmus obliquus TaxID=3088 RepID=A0ABY8UQ15_TETOB|nr:hypothetical protein OEZ85_000180 [Tetradesmus obliquus]